MKTFYLMFVLFLAGCATQPELYTQPGSSGSFWFCRHLYSPNTMNFAFKEENIEFEIYRNCNPILLNKGKCPSYIKIVDIKGKTLRFTEKEWENYSCVFKEEK